ncbi:MAG: right-handed parallel beta-helix repeat-containing protein, partial [Chloroflexi bacterium]|nr:right-handed parallel beta-helix repeat-containing protein [Chloroflexota bacterium]
MTRPRLALAAAAATILAAATATVALPLDSHAAEGRTIEVPGAHATLEAAIAAAEPGDLILVGAGVYPGGIVVPESKPGITIRGVDRNTVVLDGADRVQNAIEVEADGVTLENMTAHNYVENGFYWDGVDGYAGRYLTVWNVGLYGIYAVESRDGVIEHSYVSGAADAAFYIGECYPCDAALRDVTATLSAVGYSGTNAGGNLVLEDSFFDANGTGILPNSFDVGLAAPPQREATFRRNLVSGSGTVPTPRRTPLGGFAGIGIGIAGGVDNHVEDNEVSGSARYGIAVFTTVDRESSWVPSDNRVTGNLVSGSGTADLALAAGSGAGNC